MLLATIARVIAAFWIGWVCADARTAARREVDPAAEARAYAVAHYPREFGRSGAGLSYIIEDHGEVWTVEIAPQAQAGGGLRLMVGRKDGHVQLVGRTQ